MNRKVLAAILILLGIAICVSLICIETSLRYRAWSTNDSGKADAFPSFSEYLWSISKGAYVISFALGAIPCSFGIVLLRKHA